MLLNELSHYELAAVANMLSTSMEIARWSEGALVGRIQLLHIPLQEHFNAVPKWVKKSVGFNEPE